jgi:cytochrome c oxidase subunit 4
MSEIRATASPRSLPAIRAYLATWVGLLALLGLTVLGAGLHLGIWNTVVSLTIALLKAMLVILFFMNARHGSKLSWLIAATGVFWLAIMVSLTLTDYPSRGWVAGGK